MTAKRRRQLGEWIRDLADSMGLRDWHLEISWDEPETTRERQDGKVWGASCEPMPGRKYAIITIPPDIEERHRPDIIRATVVHELVHCHFGGMVDQVRNDLYPHLMPQVYAALESSFTRHLEFGVDGIAEEWARRLPLPPKA